MDVNAAVASRDNGKVARTDSRVTRRHERGALIAVGLNFWSLAVVVPAAVAEAQGAWYLGLAVLPLLFLALAVIRRDPLSVLVLYPVAVVSAFGALPYFTLGSPHPPLARLSAAAGLLLYGAVGSRAVTRVSLDPAITRPLPSVAEDSDAERRRRLRRWLLGAGGLGALLLAVLAPSLGSEAALHRDWGDAAAAAEVLTAVVAGALATVGMAGFLGPATRRRRQPIPWRRGRARALLLLMVVAAGLVVWGVMRRHGI